MSAPVFKVGQMVTLRRELHLEMGTEEDRKLLYKIINSRVNGKILKIESMGELDFYKVDFGHNKITEDWWWEARELYKVETTP